MICCKIITDYNGNTGSFGSLCTLLGKKGDWIWNGDAIFFADIEGSTNERSIINCVKKAGYTKVYVDVYDRNNEPHENEDVKSWITDKVFQIYYKQFEEKNQAVLMETKRGLDEIEQELDNLIREAKKQQESKTQTTEDNDNGRKD